MGSDLSLLELEIEAAKDAIHGLRSTVIALRAENARLREHYDAASPEHNLLALLDLYHDRECAAVRENAKLRACLDAVTAATDGRIGADAAVTLTRGALRDARAALDAPPNTALARSAVAWCLCAIGSWTNARWDQHLRDKFGDDIAEAAGAFLLSVGIDVETFARRPVSAALDAKEGET